MKTVTVSSKGQIGIPKEIRDMLQIKQGDQLILHLDEGKIVLEPTLQIPRSQAWFWQQNIQDKIKQSEAEYQKGLYQRYEEIEQLLDDLS